MGRRRLARFAQEETEPLEFLDPDGFRELSIEDFRRKVFSREETLETSEDEPEDVVEELAVDMEGNPARLPYHSRRKQRR